MGICDSIFKQEYNKTPVYSNLKQILHMLVHEGKTRELNWLEFAPSWTPQFLKSVGSQAGPEAF